MPHFTHAELGARWESEPPRDAEGAPACVFTADQARVTAAPERPSQRSRDPYSLPQGRPVSAQVTAAPERPSRRSRDPHSLPQRGPVSAWPGGTASPWRVATGQLQD